MRMNQYNAARTVCNKHGIAHDVDTECYYCEGVRLESSSAHMNIPEVPKYKYWILQTNDYDNTVVGDELVNDNDEDCFVASIIDNLSYYKSAYYNYKYKRALVLTNDPDWQVPNGQTIKDDWEYGGVLKDN